MATLLDQLNQGEMPESIHIIAEDEGIDAAVLAERVRAGRVVVPHNNRRTFRPMGIGEGLRTKINANIGTSPSHYDIAEENAKMGVAIEAGADSVMDLSTGGDLRAIRAALLDDCPVMMGSVPIYYLSAVLAQQKRDIVDFSVDELFDAIDEQCASGIDYITVHCGTTRRSLEALESSDRVMGIVSRGGSIIAAWMKKNDAENPLYEFYDRLLAICHTYDVTLSLGDSLRPGSVCDATDRGQIEELVVLGELARRARDAGVQAMIEGPGHVPLDQVVANVQIQKRLCDGAPFYVLGPLTTDIAPGYDHITAAIGGAVAAMAGADFLCYVTPAEHLTLPDIKDVRQGVIAAKIAAHSGDIAKGLPQALARDREMSRARNQLDWEGMFRHAIDPVVARARRMKSEDAQNEVCTMCGELCAIRTYRKSVDET
ncbi:MAG: phosphomethylpyrimidine synthase ThiC [Candidatus Lernaella stagnicola]|nr:phosphomethylpyrimidine synthase ThiC [Candidatus Lernaella stagnicola]